MASYAELFDIGEDFAAFVGHGLATEQGAVARFRQKLESNGLPSALTERLQRIERRYRLLVAGEMWCPDCQINLAALDFAQRLQPNMRAETAPAPASQWREQPAPRPRYCKRCRRPALSR